MISLRVANLLIAVTAALVTLAWASHDPLNLMLAVASMVFAWQILAETRGDAAAAVPAPARARRVLKQVSRVLSRRG
ncbi:MAG TPA: hypothetical protein VFG63_13145 [Nocardioidaceae bacterium]|nr:hypothetical protein [Nocardioidaceae bacterium]